MVHEGGGGEGDKKKTKKNCPHVSWTTPNKSFKSSTALKNGTDMSLNKNGVNSNHFLRHFLSFQNPPCLSKCGFDTILVTCLSTPPQVTM